MAHLKESPDDIDEGEMLDEKIMPIEERQNSQEIISAIAQQSGLTRSTIATVFKTYTKIAYGHLVRGGSGAVPIPLFGGKFVSVEKPERAPRKIYSPLIDKEVVIPPRDAKLAVKFVSLKPLKEAVERSD